VFLYHPGAWRALLQTLSTYALALIDHIEAKNCAGTTPWYAACQPVTEANADPAQ
jgi:hypothetical protein